MSLLDINKDIFSITDIGLVRLTNEDNCGIAGTPNGLLCVVCDGMGGHAGGAEASRIAVECIITYLDRQKYPGTRTALNDALEFANLQIIGVASENPELKGMGTTACVLLVQNACVWTAHAGDSRIYLYVAKEQRLYRLTKDHSFVQTLVEQGIIYGDEAESHPDKNRILKALGLKENLCAEICSRPVLPAKGDIFLICSDGLSGMVSDEHIEKILANKTNMQQKEASLMSAAKKAGGTDNITFQMVRIRRSPHKKSTFENFGRTKPKPEKKAFISIKYVWLILIVAASILAGVCFARAWGGAGEKPENSEISHDDDNKENLQNNQQ
jgi:protein phosphatase